MRESVRGCVARAGGDEHCRNDLLEKLPVRQNMHQTRLPTHKHQWGEGEGARERTFPEACNPRITISSSLLKNNERIQPQIAANIVPALYGVSSGELSEGEECASQFRKCILRFPLFLRFATGRKR